MKRIIVMVVCWFFLLSGIAYADLVGYYAFEGNTNDLSGYGHDGTLYGDTTFNDGFIGQSAYFDGSGDYIRVIPNYDNELTGSPFSIASWVMLTAPTKPGSSSPFITNTVHQRDHRFNIFYNDDDPRGLMINYQASVGTLQSRVVKETNMELNKWYHVTTTGGDSELRLYVNGTLADAVDMSYTEATAWNGPFYIGGDARLGRYMTGSLDETYIFNHELSIDEIQNLYNPIPEPATMLLLGSGLVGLAGFRRKYKK